MKTYESQVCIVGAGPSGLAAAIGLALADVPFVLLDAGTGPVTESRALVMHAGGTEVLRHLGVADELVDAGLKMPTFRIYGRRRTLTTIPWDSVASPFPFILFVPQRTTESVLHRRLAQLGAQPLHEHRVTGVAEVAGGYEVTGDGFAVRAPYLVGADGLGSTVRRELGITLPTGTYDTAFLLGDVDLDGPLDPTVTHVFPSRHGLLFFGPTADGPWRLIITVRTPRLPTTPTKQVLQRHVDERGPGGLRIKELTWSAAFRAQHGVASSFGHGGAALVGDAAHTHSPTGGQGLNTGIQDAYDLAATLAAIHRGAPAGAALAGYRSRRHAAAQEVVQVTHRVHQALTAGTLPVHLLRLGVLSVLELLPAVRRRVARTVSGIGRTPHATGAPTLRPADNR
ncbi:FAD-dependent monooxygenase [Nonomuraea sp. NPDC050202]|uniref:FAD-dependent oxidoreductase n=1 Tax=Nonomuraea sp. NPDC050202 TaxID=3155035 RepID=UPI0033E9F54E